MIVNCSALMDGEFEYLEEAHMIIDKAMIGRVDDGFEKGAIDMKECVAIPGLINAHTHVGDSFAKEASAGLTVSEAVGRKGRKWEMYAQASEKIIMDAMKETIRFMQDTGTTAFADFREQGIEGVNQLERALDGFKIKSVILGRDIQIQKADGLGINTYQLDQIPENREGKIVAVHGGEEKEDIRKALDANPNVIIHFTTASADEIKEAAKKKIGIVVCPRANAYLKTGVPPVREMIDAGVNVALGTDNVMINSPNMWREMEYAYKQCQLHGGASPVEVLRMATVNAAKIFNPNAGALEKGRNADIVFIDMNSANLRYNKDIIATLVNRVEPANVKKVMVNGVFVK